MNPRPLLPVTAVLCLVACGKGSDSTPEKRASAGKAMDALPSAAETPAEPAPRPPELRDFEHAGDEAEALSTIRSLPAWSTVLERYRLLDRRSQKGATHGLLVQVEEQLRLVDETTGEGSLSIPVRLPEGLEIELPARVLLWGAWHLQAQRWIWVATRVESLAPATGELPYEPGLEPRDAPAPEGVVSASSASRRGGPIVFAVHSLPERLGDGWLISDQPKGEAVARLLLPGEDEPYGDQSSIADEERWKLKAHGRYWVEIRRFRPSSGEALPVYRASGVPHHARAGFVPQDPQ